MRTTKDIDLLVSLPSPAVKDLKLLAPHIAKECFAASDPIGNQLGSGGGTVYLLIQAWKKQAPDCNFFEWLSSSNKLMIHGSGQSRRLPAYAASGKPLAPIPIMNGLTGQFPGQTLLDIQQSIYSRFYMNAPDKYVLMIACGDVLVMSEKHLPIIPEADIAIFGMPTTPEEAQNHGALFCSLNDKQNVDFFLQKPDIKKTRELQKTHLCYLDSGIWLFSEKAVKTLCEKCGMTSDKDLANKMPENFDIYSDMGVCLGKNPVGTDRTLNALSTAVIPMQQTRFLHFGTNQSLISSTLWLTHHGMSRTDQLESDYNFRIIQNSQVEGLSDKQKQLWIDNAMVKNWSLNSNHVLTSIPENSWNLNLPSGICIDCSYLSPEKFALRFYGFGDFFRGTVEDPNTIFCGIPFINWLEQRGLSIKDLGLYEQTDLQEAEIFPVLNQISLEDNESSDFVNWLVSSSAKQNTSYGERYINSKRVSAKFLLYNSDFYTPTTQKRSRQNNSIEAIMDSFAKYSSNLDLHKLAKMINASGKKFSEQLDSYSNSADITGVHCRMIQAKLSCGKEDDYIDQAFEQLGNIIINNTEQSLSLPSKNVKDDQLVWGRSPIRLDLAGGWSDTPPYCIEYGGKVVNVAVDLNGQSPIQVFCRFSADPAITIRSIDLGVENRVTTYDDIRAYNKIGSEFSIVKAALALAGFEPRFHRHGGYSSLTEQLKNELGGGLDISTVCAIPKGSGLGTSSVLATTILGSLSKICGLQWNENDIIARVSSLEQMLTSGGGWQDQIGALYQSIKLIETSPGIEQKPILRWLPENMFSEKYTNNTILLYYTGITRIAKNILSEIVKNLFLNSKEHLNIINEIQNNALFTADAIQRNDWNAMTEGIRRSWMLNQRLDEGTNQPEIQKIIDIIDDYADGYKLLGAGGGGYMLIFAKDIAAGLNIKEKLKSNPPNKLARLVDISLSETGFQVTTS